MSAVNLINENDDEREIACQAACALRESFITAALGLTIQISHKRFYVKS